MVEAPGLLRRCPDVRAVVHAHPPISVAPTSRRSMARCVPPEVVLTLGTVRLYRGDLDLAALVGTFTRTTPC